MQRKKMKPVMVKKWETSTGLPAIVLLVGDGSHHCGYVGVPKDHPLHGRSYDDPAPPELAGLLDHAQVGKRGPIEVMLYALSKSTGMPPSTGILFDVHGGITFSDGNTGADPYPDTDGNDELWWFGYDCAHAGDKTKHSSWDGDVFRDADYCEAECESLSKQLWAMGEIMKNKLTV